MCPYGHMSSGRTCRVARRPVCSPPHSLSRGPPMTNADTVQELRFEPPPPGCWERNGVHFPRRMTRYWQEVHPAAFARGTGDFARFYGMLVGGLGSAYVDRLCYPALRALPAVEVA